MGTDAWGLVLLVGLLLGTVLGLFGGGGGVLAVPLLVGLLGLTADAASTMSLVVVGLGALAGLVPHARAGRVDWRTGASVGVLGVAGAVLGSRVALWADDRVQLYAFSVVLLTAGVLMARATRRGDRAQQPRTSTGPDGHAVGVDSDVAATAGGQPRRADRAASSVPRRTHWWVVVPVAAGLGAVTGFFGVGGGFLVVPTLVAVLGVAVRVATATGLVVIAINAASALAGRWGAPLDARLAAELVVPTVVAAVVAASLSHRVPSRALGYGFAALTVVMAVVTLVSAG